MMIDENTASIVTLVTEERELIRKVGDGADQLSGFLDDDITVGEDFLVIGDLFEIDGEGGRFIDEALYPWRNRLADADGLGHYQGNKDSERCQDQQHNSKYGKDGGQRFPAAHVFGEQMVDRCNYR